MGSGFRVVVAASPQYKSGDARRSAMAGFPRIVSPPRKVPHRDGEGSGGMKKNGEMHLKDGKWEYRLAHGKTAKREHRLPRIKAFPAWGRLLS